MLWACLHFSDLPLRAVFEGDQQRPCIVLANAQAQRSGVQAGQPLAAARAICTSLQARPRDIAAEKRLLQSLAAWAYAYSSQISIAEPDALLIEIGASLQLFGGWDALQRRLHQ